MRAFGYENPEDIIGASFEQWGGNGQVIGVVQDPYNDVLYSAIKGQGAYKNGEAWQAKPRSENTFNVQ